MRYSKKLLLKRDNSGVAIIQWAFATVDLVYINFTVTVTSRDLLFPATSNPQQSLSSPKEISNIMQI